MAKTPAAKTSRTRTKSRKPTLRVQVQHDIDKALAQAGIPSAIDSDGWRWMQDPTGKGLIGVVAVTGQREDLSLRVVAPITPLPKGQAALLRALRRIAEMNYEIPGHSRLAIDSHTIWAVVAHSVGDIGAGRCAELHLRLRVAVAGRSRMAEGAEAEEGDEEE